MQINILRDYTFPDLLHQTPGNNGEWNNFKFNLDQGGRCDFAIVLNKVKSPITVECPPQNIWSITQEPPTENLKFLHKGTPVYHKIFTQDSSLKGARYINCQPALPWHVNKSYDELVRLNIPKKDTKISWVTSNKTNLKGHRQRMKFCSILKTKMDFDLFGNGFNYIPDKWDAIAPYKYSLAIENFRNEYYWSEKISDCYLSWTMPIYYGCSRITEYFPKESLILISDLNDVEGIVDQIQTSISKDRWKTNLEAIEYARNLVLNQYQLFPMIANLITAWGTMNGAISNLHKEEIIIPPLKIPSLSFAKRTKLAFHRRIVRFQNYLDKNGFTFR